MYVWIVCRCMNGGTCDPSSGECMCPPNYYGDLCSEYCSVECQNGGTLIPEPCTCSCPLNYAGVECQTCTRECQNGGTLVAESCTCVCPDYYTGENCETCSIECQNGGIFLPESCTCSCPPNFYGDVCDIYCPRECQNGGTLIPENCSCLCAVNYTGEECACKGNSSNIGGGSMRAMGRDWVQYLTIVCMLAIFKKQNACIHMQLQATFRIFFIHYMYLMWCAWFCGDAGVESHVHAFSLRDKNNIELFIHYPFGTHINLDLTINMQNVFLALKEKETLQ